MRMAYQLIRMNRVSLGGQISNEIAVFGLCANGGTGCPGTTIFGFAPATTAFGADWDLSPGGAGSGIQFYVNLTGGSQQVVSPGNNQPCRGRNVQRLFRICVGREFHLD